MICNKRLNPKKDIFRHKLFYGRRKYVQGLLEFKPQRIKRCSFSVICDFFSKKEHLWEVVLKNII